MAFSCFFKLLTWNVVLVSVIILALGVANLTVQCSNMSPAAMPGSSSGWTSHCNMVTMAGGSPSGNAIYLIIQASTIFGLAIGIVGGLPCLVSGIGTLRVVNKPNPGKNWLWLLVTLSTLFASPVTVLLSAFTAAGVFAQIQALPSGSTVPPGMTAGFAVPLTIAILTGLVFLHLLAIHCKLTWFDDEDAVTVVDVPVKIIQAPPPPMPEPVLRSTAWHVAAPGAGRCNCHVYGH